MFAREIIESLIRFARMVTTKKAFENLVVTLFNSFDSYSLPKSIVKAKPAATDVALLLKHGPSKNQVALVLPDDGSEDALKIKSLIEKAKIKFESAKIHNKWPGLIFSSTMLPKIKTLLKDYSISQYQSKDFEKTAPVAKKSFKRSSKVSDQREDIIKRGTSLPKPTLTLVENKWGNLSLGTLVFYEFEVDNNTRVLCIGTQNTKAKVNLAQPWASVVPLSDAAEKKIKAVESSEGMKVDVLNEETFEELINDEQRDALIKRGLIDFGEAKDEESDEDSLEVEEEDGYALSSDEEDSEEDDSDEDEDEEVEDDSDEDEDLESEESEEEEDFGSSEDESEDDSDDYNTADEEEGSIEVSE